MGLAAAFLGGVALLWQNDLSLLFYPVFVNLTLLGVFALSLTQRQSLVERLARLSHPDLPPAGVRYTRRVTQAWCVFFVLNASLALWSVGAGKTVWAVYNGGIAYGLIGLMFTGEWFIRRYRIGRDTNE